MSQQAASGRKESSEEWIDGNSAGTSSEARERSARVSPLSSKSGSVHEALAHFGL